MTASVDLLPCPFCGSSARMHSWWDKDGDAGAVAYCTRKGISDACASMYVARSSKRTAEQDVARMWNRRAVGAATVPPASPTQAS